MGDVGEGGIAFGPFVVEVVDAFVEYGAARRFELGKCV
jgi:hypothetical protein